MYNPELEAQLDDNESELYVPPVRENSSGSGRMGYSYFELLDLPIPPREEIITGLGRGEVGTLNSVNNAGKTTLLRNVTVAMAIGRVFAPFGEFPVPRRVAFIDFEDTLAFLRDDLIFMLRNVTAEQEEQFNDNVLLVCDYRDARDEDLSLSNPDHLKNLSKRLAAFKPDLIIIDTIGSAFQITNENDNAEVRKSIMRPLKRLAKDANSALLATHHIGKSSTIEQGRNREASHRSRGASSFADMARLVLNLEKDNPGQSVVLSCAKIKGPKFDDTTFLIDPGSRWFKPIGIRSVEDKYHQLLRIFDDGESYRTAEVIEKFRGLIPDRTVKDYLSRAVKSGALIKVKQGVYQKTASG